MSSEHATPNLRCREAEDLIGRHVKLRDGRGIQSSLCELLPIGHLLLLLLLSLIESVMVDALLGTGLVRVLLLDCPFRLHWLRSGVLICHCGSLKHKYAQRGRATHHRQDCTKTQCKAREVDSLQRRQSIAQTAIDPQSHLTQLLAIHRSIGKIN